MNTFSYNNYNNKSNPYFGAAKDLTLQYMLEKRAKYLPQRVLTRAKELAAIPAEYQPSLKELHFDVYKPLFEAKTLGEAKKLYPEFKDVLSAESLLNIRTKNIGIIESNMPLEEFTLKYLQDLYSLITENKITEKYGFACNKALSWLNEKLNIPKPSGKYNTLVKMTDEEENKKAAKASRQYYKNNPEECRKKSEQVKEFHRKHPELARKSSMISKLAWEKCPEIKEAMSKYTAVQDIATRNILDQKIKGEKPLTEGEKIILKKYYKNFWASYPQFKEIYGKAYNDAHKELLEKGLISEF